MHVRLPFRVGMMPEQVTEHSFRLGESRERAIASLRVGP